MKKNLDKFFIINFHEEDETLLDIGITEEGQKFLDEMLIKNPQFKNEEEYLSHIINKALKEYVEKEN